MSGCLLLFSYCECMSNVTALLLLSFGCTHIKYMNRVCVLAVRCTGKKKKKTVFIWLRGFQRAVRRSLRLDLPRVRGEWEITRAVRREEVKNNLSSLCSLSHSLLSCCPSHLCCFFFLLWSQTGICQTHRISAAFFPSRILREIISCCYNANVDPFTSR